MTRRFIAPPSPGRVFVEGLAGESSGRPLPDWACERPGRGKAPRLPRRRYRIFWTSSRVLQPDLDVPLVVMDRLEADLPDDFGGPFIHGLQREDHVTCVALDESGGRVHCDDPAPRDYRDPVGKKLRFLHVVRGEKYWSSPCSSGPAGPSTPRALRGGRARRRLVEEHDLRVIHERHGDSKALFQALRRGSGTALWPCP